MCALPIFYISAGVPAFIFIMLCRWPVIILNKVRAIPHNSKCRHGERGAAAAKPKAQIILDAAKVSAASGGNSEPKQGQRSQSARGVPPKHDAGTATRHYRAFWQRSCRAAAAGVVLKPSGGNCAVLPKENDGYFRLFRYTLNKRGEQDEFNTVYAGAAQSGPWLAGRFCGNNYHCGGGGAAGAFYKPKKVKCPICRTTLKPFPLAEICRRWGFLKEGRSMAQPQCGKSLS